MKKPQAKWALPFFGMAILLLGVVKAQEGVGPLAGTGGVMRDAERRAFSQPQGKLNPVVPKIDANSKKDQTSESDGDKVVGPIANVKIYGATNFAERAILQSSIASSNENDNAFGRVLRAFVPSAETNSNKRVNLPDRLLEKLNDGKEKTRQEIESALGDVRQDYLKLGYFLCRLSPSRSAFYSRETQTLGVLVDEGRIGTVNVKFKDDADEGTWYSKKQILRRFRYLKEGDAFDYARIRDVLFDVNSSPDLTVDTHFKVRKPIEGEGADRRVVRYADLDLTVSESIPLHMVWQIDNFGMEEVEEWQTSLTMQYLNLTKHDDVLTISPAMSFGAELLSFAASYMLPHTWWLGGNTTLYGGWSDLDVDNIVPRLDLEGTGWFTGLQHSEYLYDSDKHLWAASVGLLWRYIEDRYTALGHKLDRRDVSILPVTFALSYTGKKQDALFGRNFGTLQAVFNVASSGDDLDELWTGAEEHYWILRWQLARLQMLPFFGHKDETSNSYLHQWMLFLKLEGQYTTDNLIPTEKLSLGGYNTLRGYRSRGYIGDYGVYGTTELRTPILVDGIATLFGSRPRVPFDRLQGLCFVDYGWTAFNDLPSGYDDNEFLCSLGIGARMALTKYSQMRCDVAFPIVDAYGDDDDVEVYFSVQFQF